MKPNMEDLMISQQDPQQLLPDEKFYLSTEGYFFFYRLDKWNGRSMRATLCREKTNERVHDILVDELNHHQVINTFEVKVMTP